jgi:hypothetical protein
MYVCMYIFFMCACMYMYVCVCVLVCLSTCNISIPTGRISMEFDFWKAQRDVWATEGSVMDIRTSVLEVPLFQLAILFDLCLLARSVYHCRQLPLQILV